jgi:hydrogenase assembly chaperone HypC/HupF
VTPLCDEHHCITCGDDGVPMQVLQVDADRGLALCADEDGERSTVEITLVQPVALGETVLVHAGVALVSLQQAAGA